MKKSLEVDEKIFQDAVKFYGTVLNLPPLASKIYSYLIFDFDKVGITFDEFVEVFSASKSSVSTNLNLLISSELIIDVNKMDERKRYFFANDDYKKIFSDLSSIRFSKNMNIVDINENIKNEDEIAFFPPMTGG